MDDAERLRRWQLVLPHRPYLVRIAVSRGMSWHDAEDCAQEAMVRAVGFATLDETRIIEFLATTTMRLCVDGHRLQQRDVKISVKLAPWFVDEPSPEEETCDRGEATWVASHVASLPDSQRTALAARAEGLTCHEIAARMGLSYKAVESLLSRARAYVRAAVATSFVWLASLRRRGLDDVPAGVPAMAFAALVTAAVLAPGADGPAAAATVRPPLAFKAPLAVATPRATTPSYAVAVTPAPRPPAAPPDDKKEQDDPVLPPLPTAVPTDPCDWRVPHVDSCVPLDEYEPGEGLRNCLQYGIAVSTSGAECRTS